MPVEPWPTVVVGEKEYWEVDIKARVAKESDPNAQVLILVGTPNGGIANVGPLVKGDPGKHAEIDETIDFTPLEPDDPTPDSMSWTTITPPDDDTPGVYQLVAALHKGEKGDDGDTVLDPDDYSESPLAGQMLVVNGDLDGFELAPQKIASRHVPATIANVPSGNANYTLASVTISAKTYDYRVMVFAQTVITGTGSDVAVDLVARLGGETDGNVVGRCIGLAGAKDRLTIVSACPAASGDSFDKVTAGNAATIWLRTERRSGSDTYTTSDSTTLYEVWAIPV